MSCHFISIIQRRSFCKQLLDLSFQPGHHFPTQVGVSQEFYFPLQFSWIAQNSFSQCERIHLSINAKSLTRTLKISSILNGPKDIFAINLDRWGSNATLCMSGPGRMMTKTHVKIFEGLLPRSILHLWVQTWGFFTSSLIYIMVDSSPALLHSCCVTCCHTQGSGICGITNN